MSPRPSPSEKRDRAKDALRHRAAHHPPETHAQMAHEKVRRWVYAFGALLIDTVPASDELHFALRDLTDVVAAGCHAAIARHPDRLPSLEPTPPDTAGFPPDHPDVVQRLDTGAVTVPPDAPPAAGYVAQWDGTGLGTVAMDARIADLGGNTEARTDETQGGRGDELLVFPPRPLTDANADVLILRKGEWLAVGDGRWAVGSTMSDAVGKVVVV